MGTARRRGGLSSLWLVLPALSSCRLEVILSVMSRMIVMYGCMPSGFLADCVSSISPREVTKIA